MIENLNKTAFAPFGKVLHSGQPNHGFPAEVPAELHTYTVKERRFHRSEVPVYLDFEKGMTVLAVRRDGSTVCFYLDKPVCIAVGTEFAILPYQQSCTIRMAIPDGHSLIPLETVDTMQNLKIGDQIHLGEIYTLFYREEESGFLFKGEQHSMYELTYVDRGQLHCVVDGSGFLMKQGQLMIFTPEQWHMQYTDLDMTARFLTIAFDMESDLHIHLENRVFELSSVEAAYLRQILKENERNDLFSGDAIRGNLKLLMLSILRDAGKTRKHLQTPRSVNNENEMVQRTLRFVAEHVYEKLSVEIVARQVGISTSHLTALFHRQMSISPGEYIRRVKLEESKALIREGKLNFTQIAAALQYSTIHHFSRQFKDNFGISPSEYAKSIDNE